MYSIVDLRSKPNTLHVKSLLIMFLRSAYEIFFFLFILSYNFANFSVLAFINCMCIRVPSCEIAYNHLNSA